MIAHEDDDRVVGQFQAVQGVEQPADVRVHEADRRVVRTNDFPFLLLSESPIRRTGEKCRVGMLRERFGRDLRHFDLGQRVHVEVLLRRDERTVRPIEACGNKKRAIPVRFEECDGFGGYFAVRVLVITRGGRMKGERAAEPAAGRVVREQRLLVLVNAPRVHRDIPGRCVVQPRRPNLPRNPVVVDLRDAGSDVPVVPEHLRQRHDVGFVLAELGDELVDANRVWTEACQQRRPAWVAERELGVGAVEAHSALRQPIDVRRLHDRMAVGTQIVVEIVRHDQQHVGATGGGRLCGCRYADGEHARHRAENRKRLVHDDLPGIPRAHDTTRAWTSAIRGDVQAATTNGCSMVVVSRRQC